MQAEKVIEQKILTLLREVSPRKARLSEITENTDLRNELGVNSIGLLSMVFRVEKEFQVDLSRIDFGAQLAGLRTVRDLLSLSKELLTAAAGNHHEDN